MHIQAYLIRNIEIAGRARRNGDLWWCRAILLRARQVRLQRTVAA